MTTETDHRTGDNPAAAAARPGEPAAVTFNMPQQKSDAKPVENETGETQSIGAIENMLSRLLSRLDENDRRYGAALNELNQRLNEISERTHSATASQGDVSGETLERLREQATSLAAQVNEAGVRREAQPRDGRISQAQMAGYANDDRPSPGFSDSRLYDNFADVTQRLEKSLSADQPAGELNLITRRLDDLGQRLDAALSHQNGAATLQAIEEQLRVLSAGFGEARQNHARVEAIEQNLSSLMHWVQSGTSMAPDSNRLDAIEDALNSLDRNAREMDARTVSTLEAMNEALHSIAGSRAASQNNTAPPDLGQEPAPQPQERVAQRLAARPAEDAPVPDDQPLCDVWIEEKVDAEYEDDRTAILEKQLGASIPDYQPAPGKTAKRDNNADRGERKSKGGNEFMEAARRAAAAAAQEPAGKPARNSLTERVAASLAKSKTDDAGKPRRILYFLAAGLMLTSAGLMYARLNSEPPADAAATPPAGNAPPAASAPAEPHKPKPAPGASQGETGHKKDKSGVPQQEEQPEKRSERMPPTEPKPAAARVTENAKKAHETAPATRKPPVIPISGGPVSTATVLASLTPPDKRDPMAGVSIDIKEPQPAPERRAHNARAGASLVPQNDNSARTVLSLPKRVPPPKASPARKTASTPRSSVDSARANEVRPPDEARFPASAMPPVRIGPNSLRLAAARGSPAAQVEVASRFAKGSGVPKDLKKAAEWYGRAAAQGHAPGQYRLAALYERGQGVKKDIEVARNWYRRAAELGNVRAMHNLAVLYTRNEGKGRDYTSARNWFYQASRFGLADSQFNLGVLYESGLGVKKNAAEAYKWFSLAARHGDVEAGKRREALRPGLPGRSLAAVEQSIRKWRAQKPPDEANRTGAPRGGWQNALSGEKPGLSGPDDIRRAQELLNKLGYDAGPADGKLGSQTAAAIRRFQTRNGLAPTGQLSAGVLQRLSSLAS